jgi:hypothetical protein
MLTFDDLLEREQTGSLQYPVSEDLEISPVVSTGELPVLPLQETSSSGSSDVDENR